MIRSRYALAVPGYVPRRADVHRVPSPYSGEVVAEVVLADEEALDRALTVARETAFTYPHGLPAHERAAILKRTAAAIREQAEALALLIAREGGKPLADARVEAARAANTVELAAEEATRLHGQEIPMGGSPAAQGRLAFTTREPIGVVAAVSAFNHPLNLIAHQAAPAVAAGCPVILKPALETPVSCLVFVELLREAGLPPEWAIALPAPNTIAERLATSDRIDFLSFIGSARVGWMLRSRLAPGVRAALEHGGAAPVLVDASADLDRAVPLLLKGGYYHAGQVCVSVQRIFAHHAVKDDLVGRLVAGAAALRTGDPTLPDTEVGPLIRESDVARVHDWVEEARRGGASVPVGGRPLDHQGYAPTVIDEAPVGSRVRMEEVFGPVVTVNGFESLEQGIALANETKWAFQAAVFSQDVDRALSAARDLRASAVMVNDHAAFRVDWMPFGGRGLSGLGVGGVRYSVEDLTQEKLIVLKIDPDRA